MMKKGWNHCSIENNVYRNIDIENYKLIYIYTVKPLYKKPLYKKNLFIRKLFTHLVGIQPFPH